MSFLLRQADFSQQLVEYSKRMAQESGAHWDYLQGKVRKEKLVDDLARQRKHPDGLLAVLCCLETCRSIRLRGGKNRPRLAFDRRQQRVLYYYFLDPQYGRMCVRLETWFPCTVQVYVNGHEWLARQMAQRGFRQMNCRPRPDRLIAESLPCRVVSTGRETLRLASQDRDSDHRVARRGQVFAPSSRR